MFDIWGFLLQTLNVSGAAIVLLLIKELFRDKLPPKWHFAVWGILGIILLIPAGLDGRFALFHWSFFVEIIKSWFGDFQFTQVLLPIPILFGENAGTNLFGTTLREMILGWIFVGYVMGVVVSGLKYIVSYVRLRIVLRNGQEVSEEKWAHIHQLAWRYFGTEYFGTKKFGAKQKIKLGKVIEIQGLPSAFVCGIFRPILVLPADETVDDKIILHELSHMKYKDTFWTVIICFWRCIHWCNPFLVYCANRALNDMEARCDQQVLELLEGEERRDYGRILLSMTNEKYAQTPGSTCINNGGKNIRERIEAIARFKKYPAGMRLVSVCVIIMLTLFLAVGVQADQLYEFDTSVELSMASARSTPCTTLAGALDTYGKAILEYNVYYRAMCAPQSMQEDLLAEVNAKDGNTYPNWDSGIACWPNSQSGYYVYNLREVENDVYEAVLVVKLNYPPDGVAENENMFYAAYQKVCAQKENGRWVVWALEDFQYPELEDVYSSLEWGCGELPSMIYADTVGDICVEVRHQTIHKVDNTVQSTNNNWLFGSSSYFDTTVKPHAEFSSEYYSYDYYCTHMGTQEERDEIKSIGMSVASVFKGEERPKIMTGVYGTGISSSSTDGTSYSGRSVKAGWGPTILIGGGGSGQGSGMKISELPESYAVNLYLNGEFTAEMNLYVQEEVKESDK